MVSCDNKPLGIVGGSPGDFFKFVVQVSVTPNITAPGCQIALYHPEEWMLAPPLWAFQYGGGGLLPALGQPVGSCAHYFTCQLFVKCHKLESVFVKCHKLESLGKQEPPWISAFIRMARG